MKECIAYFEIAIIFPRSLSLLNKGVCTILVYLLSRIKYIYVPLSKKGVVFFELAMKKSSNLLELYAVMQSKKFSCLLCFYYWWFLMLELAFCVIYLNQLISSHTDTDGENNTGAEGSKEWFQVWSCTFGFVQAWVYFMERCWTYCFVAKQGDCWSAVCAVCDDPIVRIWICWSWGMFTVNVVYFFCLHMLVFVFSVASKTLCLHVFDPGDG